MLSEVVAIECVSGLSTEIEGLFVRNGVESTT